jgi:hypothetical protein
MSKNGNKERNLFIYLLLHFFCEQTPSATIKTVYVGFEVITVVELGLPLDPKHGGNTRMFLWNVGCLSLNTTVFIPEILLRQQSRVTLEQAQ